MEFYLYDMNSPFNTIEMISEDHLIQVHISHKRADITNNSGNNKQSDQKLADRDEEFRVLHWMRRLTC